MEASGRYRFQRRFSLQPGLEVGQRRDGGDAPAGAGVDIGGWVLSQLTGIHSVSTGNQFWPARQISDLAGGSISGTPRKSVDVTAAPQRLRRYAAMLATFFVLTVWGMPCQLSAQTGEGPDTRPNILVFLSDDMGWGQPGFNGGTEVATPNMDRIANQGIKLTQFYVQPVCSPTRASLMTGRYAWKNGMEFRTKARASTGMRLDERTIAEALRDAGYATWMLGKWHLGQWHQEYLPLQRGFDHHYGFYSALVDSFTFHRGGILDWHRNGRPVVERGYSTFLLADEAVRLIDRHDGNRPFFLHLAFDAVHEPHDAPEEYIEPYAHLSHPKQRAMLKAMDVAMGQVMDALKRKGALDNTLIVFLNDNGGLRTAGSNKPYRGLKESYLEGGIRVPAALRWPGHILPGSESDALLHVVDLFPTFARLAKADTEAGLPLDGLDAWETIAEGAESPRQEVVYSPRVIRVGDWKLIEKNAREVTRSPSPLLLYNISEDPYEETNLAAREREKLAELRARLAYHRPFARDMEPDEEIPDFPPVVYGAEENAAFGDAVQTALEQLDEGNPGPALLRIEASGISVKLVYDEALDAASVPPADAFTVVVIPGYHSAEVTDVGVSGSEVVLTLAEPVASGNTVGLTYEVPDTGAIRDETAIAAVGVTWMTPTADNMQDVTPRDAADDTAPAVTLKLTPSSIGENGGVSTVTASLDPASSAVTTVTVSAMAVGPAVSEDFMLSTNRILTIPAGQTDSTGTVTVRSVNNTVDAPNKTVTVSGSARNSLGVTPPAEVTLTITDDDATPEVTLKLMPDAIGENGGVTTVTASLDPASSAVTTVTVSAMAVDPAVSEDFMLGTNRILTIPAGQTESTGTVTVRAVNNTVDAPNKAVTVSVSADNSQGVEGNPSPVTLRITDDDDAPEVTLKLTPDSIGENGGVTTVTASLDRASSAVTTVTVSVAAVHPAISNDFMLGTNRTLTIPAGQTESIGTVTITGKDNDVDAPNKEVRVSATADNTQGVEGNPSPVTLRITDDDDAPVLTLAVRPSAIEEADDRATVTVEIVNGTTFAEDQPIALTFAGTATKGTDYTVELERLTLTAGESSVATTVTAVDDALDDEPETIRVTARHGGGVLGAEQTITIIDDDGAPMITMASLILVAENETAVATLTATDADRPAEDLMWRITGGADRNRFRLTPDGALAFRTAPDYEAPGDSDRDRDYEVTVEVSDGANPVEAVLTVRLQDVDDTAPVFSSASVNGATLTLAYGEALDGSSTPEAGDFTVSGGQSARTVSNVGVSGRAVTLTLDPAVEHGKTGIRVSYRPGTNPIQDAAGNDALGLSNVRVTNNTGDTTAPEVSTIAITSRPERNATYAAGEEIEVTVTFSETVVVTGTPRLRLNVGGVSRTAAYRSGAGAGAVFIYRVADGEGDADGVSIEANSLTGTIRDGANNNALLTHDGVAADAGHKVDGVKPALAATGGAVVDGATLTLTYGEALDGSSTPLTLAFTVNVEGAERRVSRVAVSGSAVMLTLEPEVGVGQAVRLTYRVPGANPIQDTMGNAAGALTNRAVENNTRDTAAPSVSRVAITSYPGPDGIYANEDVIEVTVTFSETVVVDTTNGTPAVGVAVGRQTKPGPLHSRLGECNPDIQLYGGGQRHRHRRGEPCGRAHRPERRGDPGSCGQSVSAGVRGGAAPARPRGGRGPAGAPGRDGEWGPR